MSVLSPAAYGKIVNEAGSLIVETNGIYLLDIAYHVQCRRAGFEVLLRFFDAAKSQLEIHERELSSVDYPKQLKGFHRAFEKGVRGTILRWGCLRRAALGSALNMETLELAQYARAAQELGRLSETEPTLLEELKLSSELAALLWKDVEWLRYTDS